MQYGASETRTFGRVGKVASMRAVSELRSLETVFSEGGEVSTSRPATVSKLASSRPGNDG